VQREKKHLMPMLAKLTDKAFDGESWVFEIKWDGYRALGYKNKKLELISRNGLKFTKSFPGIISELKKLTGQFIIDGEIVIFDQNGKSNFQLLQNYFKKKTGTPFYCVFDILQLNRKDLTELPLIERKKILKKLLTQKKLKWIKYGEHLENNGKAFFREAVKLGLEGIIAKKKDSPYRFSRSSDWLKIKNGLRQETVIGGYTEPRGSRKHFGSLLVGVYKKGALQYSGHVGGGFNQKSLKEVYEKLQKIPRKTSPFIVEPNPNTPVKWVQPKLVCEVKFAEWTNEGIMRQPIFMGLRMDKNAQDVVRGKP
jgi:bifunctional non-homologous end joining protein LigD